MQMFDNESYAALASVDETSSPSVFRWLFRMGEVRAVCLITLASILGSLVITTVIMLSFSVPRRWLIIDLGIAALIPLLLAPGISLFVLRTVYHLESAHRLIAELAMTDVLTSAYNRRHFMHYANIEFEKAQRHGLPLSLIMLDADHFKDFNDTYGHSAGDSVLRDLSTVCKNSLRISDLFARYGGEEFVILLPLTDGAAARILAERIRRSVEKMSTNTGYLQLPVTISLGVAEKLPTITSLDALLKEADRFLYEAKNNGRNRVEGKHTGQTPDC